MSIRRCSAEYGVSRDVIRQAIKDGELRASRLGERTVRVFRADVEEWFRRHTLRPTTLHAEQRVAEILEREP